MLINEIISIVLKSSKTHRGGDRDVDRTWN